jgi:hypothetical protein
MRKIGKERIFWINKIIEMSFLKDLWGFIRERRKWWLLPLIIFLLIIGLLLIIGGNSALAPFIYTIF